LDGCLEHAWVAPSLQLDNLHRAATAPLRFQLTFILFLANILLFRSHAEFQSQNQQQYHVAHPPTHKSATMAGTSSTKIYVVVAAHSTYDLSAAQITLHFDRRSADEHARNNGLQVLVYQRHEYASRPVRYLCIR
jgi:hypothetical protein